MFLYGLRIFGLVSYFIVDYFFFNLIVESGQLTVRALLHGEILQVPREHRSETEHHLHDSCPLFVGDVLSVAGIKPPCSEGSSKNKEILSEICYELRYQSVLETKDDEECTDSRLPDHGSLAHIAVVIVIEFLIPYSKF